MTLKNKTSSTVTTTFAEYCKVCNIYYNDKPKNNFSLNCMFYSGTATNYIVTYIPGTLLVYISTGALALKQVLR